MSRRGAARAAGRPVAAPLGRAVVAAAAVLVTAGCTVGGDPVEPTGDAAPPASSQDGPSQDPEPEDTPSGPTPQELSEELLATAAQLPQPLGSVSGVVPPTGLEVTMEVLEIRPVEGATLVELRLTSPTPRQVGPSDFDEGRFGTQDFIRDIYLDDVAGGTRYLPFQFEDYRPACVCPYKPLELGPDPQVVTALFPALPDGTGTVDVRLASTDLVLTGLPVG